MQILETDVVLATEGKGNSKASRQLSEPRKNASFSLDLTHSYMRELGRHSLLSPEEELHLARQVVAGDAAARKRLIECNLRLVVKLARKYVNRGLPLLDLVAEGNLGLMHAISKFDPELGFRLSTYAAPWICHYVERSLMNNSRLVRLPVHAYKEYKAFERSVREQTQKLQHTPSAEELAQRLSRSTKDINRLLGFREHVLSLQAPVSDEGSFSLGDMIADPNHVDPLQGIAEDNLSQSLDRWIDKLPARQQQILMYRFGLRGHEEMTLEAVGAIMGLTRERVRKIQIQALEALREIMARSGHSLEMAVS